MEMTLESFSISLGHPALQRHLLAVHPLAFEEALQHSHEYRQVQASQQSSWMGVSPAYNDDETDQEDEPNMAVTQKTVQPVLD